MWMANSSTLIFGERDAILVDTFLTNEHARQLVDCVVSSTAKPRLTSSWASGCKPYRPSLFFRRQIIRPVYASRERAHAPIVAALPRAGDPPGRCRSRLPDS
jgi:hypothetical protein